VKRWYEFRAQAKGAEIVIYDEIGAFGIPAKAFLDELKALGPVAELTVRINSPGGSVFDGVAIYNALKRHQARITVWIDGIAASIASMIAMAGDEVVMPENAMLVLHDPSGLVAGTASDMRAMAEALDKMAAAMIAAYCDKSGAGDEEIAALMAAETWLSAEEAVGLGMADRVEQPVKMAAHFDLSRFRNLPPQLAAILTSSTPKEDEMSDSQKTRPRRADAGQQANLQPPAATDNEEPDAVEPNSAEARGAKPDRAALPDAVPERAPALEAAGAAPEPAVAAPAAIVRQQATPAAPVAAAQPTAQVIDLDAVRADERRATLAYVAEVHELCALAGRGDLAAGFIAKATPVSQVRRALLEARAAEDDATIIRSQVRPATLEPAQPAIDTAAIYAARNQNVR
jgi:ATP-dependent Clp endopeptidase proteolytic subunit ClpP